MPEILTESFCERCGTRYTFESAAPATGKRLGKFKTLGKGLKNFVLDDESSLDEALAAARNEEDRVTTSQQLDAFHQTFNFCMSCRQYTCANCWNDAEGRCQTCAPLAAGAFLEATAPKLRAGKSKNGRSGKEAPSPSVDALAWPTTDLRRFEMPAAPEAITPKAPVFDIAAAATPAPPAAPVEPAVPTPSEPEQAAALAHPAVEPVAEYVVPESWPEIPSLAERLAAISGPVAPPPTMPPATAKPPVAPPTPVQPAPDDDVADERAATTARLLGRFRPGQSIDDALEAYEATLRDEEAEAGAQPEPIAATPEPEPEPLFVAPEPEPVFVAPEPESVFVAPEPESVFVAPEPEPIAAAPEPEPVFVAPEPEPVEAAPAPEPIAPAPEPWPEPLAAQPEPEPTPPSRSIRAEPSRRGRIPRTDDRVELPTWRITPEATPDTRRTPPKPPVPATPAEPVRAETPPQWPGEPATDSLAFLANRNAGARDMDEVWAASARDVVAAPGSPTAPAGVQPCVSCGLSLSATARFCRRCGTRQDA